MVSSSECRMQRTGARPPRSSTAVAFPRTDPTDPVSIRGAGNSSTLGARDAAQHFLPGFCPFPFISERRAFGEGAG